MDSYNVYCFLQISECTLELLYMMPKIVIAFPGGGLAKLSVPRWCMIYFWPEVIHDVFLYLQPLSSEEGKIFLPWQWHKGNFRTRNDCLLSSICIFLNRFHTAPVSAWEGEKAQNQREKMRFPESLFVEQIQFLREKSVFSYKVLNAVCRVFPPYTELGIIIMYNSPIEL